ncbi:MAG: hypothetical protein AAF495_07360 [Pseudomonadota bacterium]
MTRKIWDDDFTGCWPSEGSASGASEREARPDESRAEVAPAGEASLGIVERNRRARREKWALRMGER